MNMDMSAKLVKLAKVLNAKFTLNDRPISHREVFADTGLLPAIARRADQLCSLCLGYGIGISFEEADKSVLGVRVIFDEVTPNVLRYLCIADVLYELMKSAASMDVTPLDELMYD
ncbi:MAG: type IV secretion protein IcmS [Legionellales bacterium]|nr:type IV secretion protein IcmS [Legionellales bacterium]